MVLILYEYTLDGVKDQYWGGYRIVYDNFGNETYPISRVNEMTSSTQCTFDILPISENGFASVFSSYGTADGSGTAIYMRWLSLNGNELLKENQVNI